MVWCVRVCVCVCGCVGVRVGVCLCRWVWVWVVCPFTENVAIHNFSCVWTSLGVYSWNRGGLRRPGPSHMRVRASLVSSCLTSGVIRRPPKFSKFDPKELKRAFREGGGSAGSRGIQQEDLKRWPKNKTRSFGREAHPAQAHPSHCTRVSGQDSLPTHERNGLQHTKKISQTEPPEQNLSNKQ